MAEILSPYLFSRQKKVIDFVLAKVIEAATHPLKATTALVLSETIGGGPTYFEQERGGLTLRKLRTMVEVDEDDIPKHFQDNSSLDDPRIPSKAAAIIRQFRLDELPQIPQVAEGVIKGHNPRLSLFGLRPLADGHADDLYKSVWPEYPDLADFWREDLMDKARPFGIISPASAYYMGRTSNKEVDPYKWMELEVDYCLNASPSRDAALALQTVKTLAGMAVGAS